MRFEVGKDSLVRLDHAHVSLRAGDIDQREACAGLFALVRGGTPIR
ncbi:hypothetical protein [Mycobacterium simiae]|nr:hypothetical protein [Mycobacterium simiae]